MKNPKDDNYSDDWSTPLSAYKNIKPFVEGLNFDKLVIWDPFFNCDNPSASVYLQKIFPNANIINRNLFIRWNDHTIPDGVDIIITNPPYGGGCGKKSGKYKSTEWLLNLNIPFMSILPISTMNVSYMRKFLVNNKIQFIHPVGRTAFEKKCKIETKTGQEGSIWWCYKCSLLQDNIFLKK
jgi:hypothetical protein